MPDTTPEKTYKAGDQVETIHGEKLTVIKIEKTDVIKKKGVVISKPRTWIFAESGGHLTKFPIENIKA